MATVPTITFSSAALPTGGTLAVPMAKDGKVPAAIDGIAEGARVAEAAKVASFKGGVGDTVQMLLPAGTKLDRMVLFGLGEDARRAEHDFLRVGGKLFDTVSSAGKVSVLAHMPDGEPMAVNDAASLAMGMLLASYRFEQHKSRAKKKDKDEGPKSLKVTIHVKDAAAARKAWASAKAVAEGVALARDLVNEPANVLTPKEFAKRMKRLTKLGCDVDVLDAKEMGKLGMGALLGVARGSRNAPRMAIIRWNGGKAEEKPVAFVGKGVTFDTGGISLKPAAGMEDMKGDMGGAAAVAGLMHALASRKAKANVVGIVACVENMPDGDAQRPGDVVTSMSGQTIEVLNTDAEGRLVLADALHHCRKEFEPRFMIDLATLTGAIMVALGKHYAGLFSNDDELSGQLSAAGEATHERVWRLPLHKDYDKMIDSKVADMKNIGGRYGGSITAGQFLKRFVGDTPWAHLDIAGTAFASSTNEYSKSWASGYGVRLLDRLVADNYEG